MNLVRKLIPMSMIIIILVSVLAPAAFAANTTDTYYYILSTDYDYQYTLPREKEDTSSVYAKVTMLTLNDRVKAQVVGATEYSGSYRNCTLSNNADTEYVTLYPSTNYSIRNMVKERGNSWAKLGFKSVGISFTQNEGVEGWWSVDSSGSYTVATK